jgi:O-methyltransferase
MGIPLDKIGITAVLGLSEDSARIRLIEDLAVEMKRNNTEGVVAECGVWRGHTAAHINRAFPDRRLYLFDTFSGFDERDYAVESELGILSSYQESGYTLLRTGDERISLLRCPYRERVVIKKGYVPDTFCGLENEKFAFVNIDMDLYAPHLAALDFFATRMSVGGVVLSHDYNESYRGTMLAVDEISKQYDLTRIPIASAQSIILVFGKEK